MGRPNFDRGAAQGFSSSANLNGLAPCFGFTPAWLTEQFDVFLQPSLDSISLRSKRSCNPFHNVVTSLTWSTMHLPRVLRCRGSGSAIEITAVS